MKRFLIIAAVLSTIGFVTLSCSGCNTMKEFLSNNKEVLKEVVKDLVGDIVEDIFNRLTNQQPTSLKTASRGVEHLVYNYLQENGLTNPKQVSELKDKIKAEILKRIDQKEINVDDYFPTGPNS